MGLGPGDSVVGIAASGRTPYVVAGLAHARARGALTVAIVNNPGSPAAAAAALAVEILTGAEIVAGSTRMTAGTTQKIALNALSTASMIALGKTYGAWMIDVRATNDKLRRRALRIVQEITGADPDVASAALAAGGGSVKQAVVALLAGVDAAEAARRLTRSRGMSATAVRPSRLKEPAPMRLLDLAVILVYLIAIAAVGCACRASRGRQPPISSASGTCRGGRSASRSWRPRPAP